MFRVEGGEQDIADSSAVKRRQWAAMDSLCVVFVLEANAVISPRWEI